MSRDKNGFKHFIYFNSLFLYLLYCNFSGFFLFLNSCDQGFGGPHCEPSSPLPMMLRDDFNGDVINRRNWKELYGGEPSDVCGIVVSGNSLLFNKVFFIFVFELFFRLHFQSCTNTYSARKISIYNFCVITMNI